MKRHIFEKLRSALKLYGLAALIFLLVPVICSQEEANQTFSEYNFNCFPKGNSTQDPRKMRTYAIGIQISDRALHQVMSRMFAILLREKLNYNNISLVPLRYGLERQVEEDIITLFQWPPSVLALINVAVWMPSSERPKLPNVMTEAGASLQPGRFGWFVPKDQIDTQFEFGAYRLHYPVFLNQSNADYERYVLPENLLNELRNRKKYKEYISPNCGVHTCVTLLAEHQPDTAFVIKYINGTGSYVNVLWLGEDFHDTIRILHQKYQNNSNDGHEYRSKRFIVLHWTPSIIIDGDINFYRFTLPACENVVELKDACKYELTPVLKYYDDIFEQSEDLMLSALRKFEISSSMLKHLQSGALWKRKNNETIEDLYNRIACEFLINNENAYETWIRKDFSSSVIIGGIFPLADYSRGHQGLKKAMNLAVNAVKKAGLMDLEAYANDGQCKSDEVMKMFIQYFTQPRILGVLGPACSETVEPIAGIARHTNMVVISYSAEGASFVDRNTYPYFFRTIGSNRQYADAYIGLMKFMGWQRVAALTEDGQKYTEYISHMETSMKQHRLELIMNKKFLSDVIAAEMNKCLLDLKQKHAKIIIADIYNRNVELALCEAYKLGMIAEKGYVWFLPSWISRDWTTLRGNLSCTPKQLQKAFEGHFSIRHTPFGDPDSVMQENITVGEWLQKHSNNTLSSYTGFVYDAVWTYAKAAAKFLEEDKDALDDLRAPYAVEGLVKHIWGTNFKGLSGEIQFGEGGSRITKLDLVQWYQLQYHLVGNFKPNVSGKGKKMHTNGGQWNITETKVVWLSDGQRPTDGTYDCSFAALAKFLNKDCDYAANIFTTLMCSFVVLCATLTSYFFWKKLYDKKIKQSAKIMKNFGIDLFSPSGNMSNTLDKWEISKDNVVLNRRLGEGAFGTVYGGEAQIGATGWTAVAVKTLKTGTSTEGRLDFLCEAEAMKRFNHKNIVQLLGVCLQTEPIYTIMEFMLYGDLKTYLLARRHLLNESVAEDSDITPKRLTMYATDVARGLVYLASKKYVHRDLACRNCLVDAQRIVKIGDFGMARSIYETDYYRFSRKGMLPVRWMAPESLALGMFTPASDIWAYGVVLFEIITFGSFPYQGLTNNQALEFIKSGKTLQIPSGVKPPLEGLIKACWSQETKKRPTAAEIVEYISNYPRLLTPCLDFPSASVEMSETESNELSHLPQPIIRRDSTLDILAQTTTINHINYSNDFIDGTEAPKQSFNNNNTIQNPTISLDASSAITPDGYSVMSPLLTHRMSESSDSSQTKLINKLSLETLEQTKV